MSTRDIQAHLKEIYGVDVSSTFISTVTDSVLDEVKQWQQRPLESVYPVVYLDGLVVKNREEGIAHNKCVYLALEHSSRLALGQSDALLFPRSGINT